MDDSLGQPRRSGGEVEPTDKTAVMRDRFRIPDMPVATRYELRDPLAEATYRSNSFDDVARRADRIGATRFVAISPDDQRTTVSKQNGEWLRPDPVQASHSRVASSPALDPGISAPPTLKGSDIEGAERTARVAELEASLHERYFVKRAALHIGGVSIGQTEYHHRGDASRIAFTESAFRLSTETNSPSVARSMVDVAEARNWQAVRLSGHEDFRRMVWLEASLRNVRTVGYEPLPGDRELLSKERAARQINRVEPMAAQSEAKSSAKQSSRGGGRKAVLAALEAVLVSKRVPESQRAAVMAAATENLARRIRKGETHRVKVYDKSAPARRRAVAPVRDVQRAHERPAPAR